MKYIKITDDLVGPKIQNSPKRDPGLNNEFDQNSFKYEFPDHENLGVDAWTKHVGILLCVLCIYASDMLKVSLLQMGP